MLHKFICRMCDDDEEGLNARAQGSTLQSLFVAPPPASIWFNQTFCLLRATRLIWAALSILCTSPPALGGAHMQLLCRFSLPHNYASGRATRWSSCICICVFVFVSVFVFVFVFVFAHMQLLNPLCRFRLPHNYANGDRATRWTKSFSYVTKCGTREPRGASLYCLHNIMSGQWIGCKTKYLCLCKFFIHVPWTC